MKAWINVVAVRVSLDMVMDKGNLELRRSTSEVFEQFREPSAQIKTARANSVTYDYTGKLQENIRSFENKAQNQGKMTTQKQTPSQHRQDDRKVTSDFTETTRKTSSSPDQHDERSQSPHITMSGSRQGPKPTVSPSAQGDRSGVDIRVDYYENDTLNDNEGFKTDSGDNVGENIENRAVIESSVTSGAGDSGQLGEALDKSQGVSYDGGSTDSCNMEHATEDDSYEEVFENAFQLLDQDASGKISFKEIQKFLQLMGQQYTDEEVNTLFEPADTDEDSELDRDELRELLRQWFKDLPDRKRELLTAFSDLGLLTNDGDNTLDKETLRVVLQENGKDIINDDEFDDVFNDADQDGSGVIELNELIDFLTRR